VSFYQSKQCLYGCVSMTGNLLAPPCGVSRKSWNEPACSGRPQLDQGPRGGRTQFCIRALEGIDQAGNCGFRVWPVHPQGDRRAFQCLSVGDLDSVNFISLRKTLPE
jgi:hypothetical protein